MMNAPPSIVLLLPYFGPLPSSWQLFVKSCAANPTINWHLITDQAVDRAQLPPNMAVSVTTFAALKRSIDARVGFETVLLTPYKLCDFRPAFALIFADEIRGFDFWGHCDTDVVFGDIRRFLTADVLHAHTKVLINGHLSLYRNCTEANHYFELEAPGVDYRDVFTSPVSRAFDEFSGVKLLLQHHGIPIFLDDEHVADINKHVYRLQTMCPPNYRHQCFYWERGRLFKCFHDGHERGRQEYTYIHLQGRRMQRPSPALVSSDAWFIRPHDFVPKIAEPTTPAEMDRMNPGHLIHDSKRYFFSGLRRIRQALSPTAVGAR